MPKYVRLGLLLFLSVIHLPSVLRKILFVSLLVRMPFTIELGRAGYVRRAKIRVSISADDGGTLIVTTTPFPRNSVRPS